MPSDQQFHHRRSSIDSSTSESPPTTPTESPQNTHPTNPPLITIPIPSKPLKCKRHPSFTPTLRALCTRLTPLVNTETGHTHPDFPHTHLSFHLLTFAQLDRLARHYHQVWPALPATTSYPFRIRPWVGVPNENCVDIETKRARFGHFIGMGGFRDGVHSGMPVAAVFGGVEGGREDEDDEGLGGDGDAEVEISVTVSEEEVLEWMAREWEGALKEARGHDYGGFRKL